MKQSIQDAMLAEAKRRFLYEYGSYDYKGGFIDGAEWMYDYLISIFIKD